MAEWWSIEVFSGDKLPASGWRYAYEDELTEAAITNGALYYEWHDSEYGVILCSFSLASTRANVSCEPTSGMSGRSRSR